MDIAQMNEKMDTMKEQWDVLFFDVLQYSSGDYKEILQRYREING